MYQRLIRVKRPYKGGKSRWKWVRPKGVKPPSANNVHRRKYVNAVRLKIINLLGGKCVGCGYKKDVRALQIDHINSDGKIDRIYTGGSYYHNIMNKLKSGRYQILCANCNAIKRIEERECPRKLDRRRK